MADDDFDYHITFPTPICTEIGTDTPDGTIEIEDECSPTVILLGWAGCKDKNLAKYSAIYEEKRCTTIRYISPFHHVFFKPWMQRTAAFKLLELIDDYGLTEYPIIIHAFSNGGAMIYQHMTEILHSQEGKQFRNLQLNGCIYDSAPATRRIKTGFKAIMNTTKGHYIVRLLIALLFTIIMGTFRQLARLLSLAGSKSSFSRVFGRDVAAALSEDKGRWPQLFLYSKKDEICLYQDIDDVIKAREGLGVHVQRVLWDDSPHVAHYRHHREAYITQCQNFLVRCCT